MAPRYMSLLVKSVMAVLPAMLRAPTPWEEEVRPELEKVSVVCEKAIKPPETMRK